MPLPGTTWLDPSIDPTQGAPLPACDVMDGVGGDVRDRQQFGQLFLLHHLLQCDQLRTSYIATFFFISLFNLVGSFSLMPPPQHTTAKKTAFETTVEQTEAYTSLSSGHLLVLSAPEM